jgi:hypothetical protein
VAALMDEDGGGLRGLCVGVCCAVRTDILFIIYSTTCVTASFLTCDCHGFFSNLREDAFSKATTENQPFFKTTSHFVINKKHFFGEVAVENTNPFCLLLDNDFFSPAVAS